MSNNQIALTLGVSENHLSKVLQRLAKVGIVKSVRGPKGGFTMGKNIEEITLLDVYEAIDGPVVTDDCLLSRPICGGGKACILGGLLRDVNVQVKKRLSSVKLSDI